MNLYVSHVVFSDGLIDFHPCEKKNYKIIKSLPFHESITMHKSIPADDPLDKGSSIHNFNNFTQHFDYKQHLFASRYMEVMKQICANPI